MPTYAVKVRVLYEGTLVVDEPNPVQAQTTAKAIINGACVFDSEKVPSHSKQLCSSEAQEVSTDMLVLPPCPGVGP